MIAPNSIIKDIRNEEALRIIYNANKDNSDIVMEISKNPATPLDVIMDIAIKLPIPSNIFSDFVKNQKSGIA